MSSGGQRNIPKLPKSIGGDIHMMIGIKYLRYHPKLVFQSPTGLHPYLNQNLSTQQVDVVWLVEHILFSQRFIKVTLQTLLQPSSQMNTDNFVKSTLQMYQSLGMILHL